MEMIWVLVPLGVILLGVAIWGFFWAVDNNQFDDLEIEGRRLLDEEDE